MRAVNVIDTAPDAPAVAAALRRALDPAFRASLADMRSPFGDGKTSDRILEVLAAADGGLRRKRFFDLPDGPWRRTLVLGSDRP